ncbi:MAG TPA: penicillin-binding protein 1C [Xanthobacteraceae bacterium]|nr:penicillin-binding protein 1C [Xanthobacteraceae bacterium]
MNEAQNIPSAHSRESGNPEGAAVARAETGSPLSRGRAVRIGLIAASLACLSLLAAWWIASLGPAPLGQGLEFSKQVLDRNGHLLRAYATTDGRWRLPAKVSDVDPRFFDVLFAYEDKRFRAHHGVDPLAVTRAAFQFASSGRLRSGASTLTMQVARLVEGRHPRDLAGKLKQMVRAIEMERALSKDQILTLYLDLAPYGGNIEGIRAASLVYLGKEPRWLTLAEAALLVALPQSPEPRRPDRAPDLARAARDRVLDRFAATGKVPADEIALAKSEPVPTARHAMPMLAPHASDQAVAQDPSRREFRLTIDAAIQNNLEQLARERERTLTASLGPNVSLAIFAVDNATGQVLAHVGSPSYFDARRSGQVDMTQALRSPGSTLKPFIYGLGFEDGFIHPETLIEDRPVSYGAYAPKDFDFGFKGTLSVREALQFSLNVPAVAVLDRVGPARLAARLTQAGATLALPDGQAPGLALGLGGVGIKLADLVQLYSGIARQGLAVPLSERLNVNADPSGPQARRLMEPVAAWYVGDVLLGSPPPENGVAGRIVFKTGTSYGYRDAWSVGFDGKRTIGVWVGRPDGAPVPGLVGRSVAAPILFDAFARIGGANAPLPHPPAGVVFASNAKLPPPLRHFQPGRLAGATAQPPLRIMFPPDGARLDLTKTDGKPDPVALKVTGAVAPLTVLVNGVPVSGEGNARGSSALFFNPGPGFSRITVMDASGTAASVVVRVDDAASMTSVQPAFGAIIQKLQ